MARQGKNGPRTKPSPAPRDLRPVAAGPKPNPKARASGKAKAPRPLQARKVLLTTTARNARPKIASKPKYTMGDLETDIPVPFYSGKALGVAAVRRDALSLNPNQRAMYFISNIGTAATVAGALIWTKGDAVANAATFVYSVPLIGNADDNNGPSAGRCQKYTWELHTTTPVLNRGSQYFILELENRVTFSADPANGIKGNVMDGVFDQLSGMHTTQPCDTSVDAKKRGHGKIVDYTEWTTFQPWHGNMGVSEFFRHIGVWSGVNPLPRPMSTTVLMFDTPANIQTLNLTFGLRSYCRFPTDSIPGRMHKHIPIAGQDKINHLIGHADGGGFVG